MGSGRCGRRVEGAVQIHTLGLMRPVSIYCRRSLSGRLEDGVQVVFGRGNRGAGLIEWKSSTDIKE